MASSQLNNRRRQKPDLARQIESVKVISGATPVPQPCRSLTLAGILLTETPDLLDVVVRDGYAGAAWDELQQRLVRGSFRDLETAIRSGIIYRRCARAGVAIERRSALQVDPYPEDIAAEAVEDCLERFRTRVLPAGEWDPGKGSSLEEFFSICCLPDVANRWRWHLRHLPESSGQLDDETNGRIVSLAVDRAPGPAETLEARELVRQTLAPMKPADQSAFVLLAAGWSAEEIAQTFGIARNTLDARISRARKAARARRTP
jgi:DNA-directed RNA polymerase specialized sigma24 family protein